LNSGKLDAKCGSGVWVGPNHERNTTVRVPGPLQSGQTGEIAAILIAVESVPRFWPITIITESKYAINGLTKHLHTWEDNGWIGIKNMAFFRKTAHLPTKQNRDH
jgi:ribonuclease HI